MKKFACGIVWCFLVGRAFWPMVEAQTPGGGYNPYTAQGYSRGGRNPFTGIGGQPVPVYNALTGPEVALTQANAFTGATPHAAAPANPYTGGFAARGQPNAVPGSFNRDTPISGKAGPGLEDLDAAMLRILEKHAIPGAALAIAKDGRLVVARGYGWASLETGEPVWPEAIFSIASLSKSITAVTILKLVDEGKFRLDDKAFRLLDHLRPAPGTLVDPRLYDITVRQLLNHSAGWDRKISGEPSSFSWRVSRQLRVPLPVSADQLIVYMLGQPLDFDSGTQARYSNFGYIVLGQIIEHVTRQPYGEYVLRQTLEPMGIKRAILPGLGPKYPANEVRRYNPGTLQLLPPRTLPPLADAAGSWLVSAVDLVRFLTALHGAGGAKFLSDSAYEEMLAPPPPPLKPRQYGFYCGLGWDQVRATANGKSYFKDGLLPGSRTFMGHAPDGIDWVVLFNAGNEMTPLEVVKELDPKRDLELQVHKTRAWPKVDLFKDFPR